jgi:NADH dehydrogenase
MSESFRMRRVVIAGGGFAGFNAARTLSRLVNGRWWKPAAGGGQVEIVLVSPADHFLPLPLLPEVAAGIPDLRRIAVPLAGLGRASG